jgi:type II secretory pathway component GspD/PulD (secretin)
MQFGSKSMNPVKSGWKVFGSLGTLCYISASIAGVAHAQSDIPSLFPLNGSDATAAVAVPAAPVLPTGPALITLSFKDVAVAELISMIAEQGNVGIIVSNDVDARLANVNLIDKTPEEAIRYVAATAGLQWRQLDSRTYAVAKTLSEVPPDNVRTFGPTTAPVAGGIVPSTAVAAPPVELPQLYQSAVREQKDYRKFDLRHVTPRIMAWWLDPDHNEVPIQFKSSLDTLNKSKDRSLARLAIPADQMNGTSQLGSSVRDSYNPWSPAGSMNRNSDMYASGNSQFNDVYTNSNPQFGGRGNQGGNNRGGQFGGGRFGQGAAGAGVFQLPEGIESMSAIDPQNALLVRGTPEGIAQLEEIISLLDRPLRQVEIEAQFVTVSTNDSKAFGIDFSSSNGPFRLDTTGRAPQPADGSITLGFVRNNFRATLSALTAQGKAKTVSSPRVTAINNLTASLQSQSITPVILTTTTDISNGQGGVNTRTAQTPVFISSTIGLTVTPTINNDDTVTVVMQPEVTLQTPVTGQIIPNIESNTLDTIANVRDGDTIALGGLKSKRLSFSKTGVPILRNIPILGKLFESNNTLESDTELIIFLTARIIRRLDDPVPGT